MKCVKCGNNKFKKEQRAMAGTGASRFMNIQRHHYWFLICDKCGYTEIYEKERASKGGQVLDLLSG